MTIVNEIFKGGGGSQSGGNAHEGGRAWSISLNAGDGRGDNISYSRLKYPVGFNLSTSFIPSFAWTVSCNLFNFPNLSKASD